MDPEEKLAPQPAQQPEADFACVGEVVPASLKLVFPPDNTFCGLYRLWSGSSESLYVDLTPAPSPLSLGGQDLAQEGALFYKALTEAAKARWQRIASSPDRTLPDLDGEIVLHLTRDAMLAWMVLLPPVGRGRPVNMLRLAQELSSRQVSEGIDWAGVESFLGLEPRYFQPRAIAWGVPAQRGEDGRVVDFYPRTERKNTDLTELGKEDYASLHLVQDVKKGSVICQLMPSGEGKPGRTVTGIRVPAKRGRPVDVPKGRNTTVSEDGKYLVATMDGHVEFTGHSFQVKPVLEIPGSVAPEDGTIQFMGDVHICGDVASGTVIRAMGSIQVDGVVEGAAIEAGEYLVVSGGIQGQDSAVIQAHKGVYAKYLEHCAVYAVESVVADCIIESDIYCNGNVTVRTGRAAIVGGSVRAAGVVSAGTVGSKAERPTAVILGGLPCERLERSKMQAEVKRLEEKLRRESRGLDTPEKRSKISRLNLNLCVTKLKLEKLDKDLDRAAIQLGDGSRLLCDEAYPGAVITVGKNVFRVRQLEKRRAFCPGRDAVNVITV